MEIFFFFFLKKKKFVREGEVSKNKKYFNIWGKLKKIGKNKIIWNRDS